MTPQEHQLIDGLVERIRNTQVTDKDIDAEQYLQQGLAGYPEALYVLAQTVLVQQYGLTQAQQQIQQLREELEAAHQQQPSPSGGSFLSKIFGGGSSAQTNQNYAPPQPPYQPVNNPGYEAPYPPPPYAAPVYAQPMAYGSGGGGFLRGALQTAAGVAAGELAFQSMESLFHGFGGGGYGYEGRPGETVVNNYYDDAAQHDHHESATDSSFYNPSDDASRQNPDASSQNFADSTTNDLSADNYGTDDNSLTDTGNDFGDTGDFDSGNFDSGGGFDDGGSDFGGGGDGSF
jgi:uncharacterized protein